MMALIASVLILQFLDILTTEIGLSIGCTEQNALYHVLGGLEFYALKIGCTLWAMAVIKYTLKIVPETFKRKILYVLIGLTLFVVLNNLLVISAQLRPTI